LWADEIGLHAQSPATFEASFKDRRAHYIVVVDTLRQIGNLGSDHRQLERKYGLKPLSQKDGQKLSSEFRELLSEDTNTLAVTLSNKAQEVWEQELMDLQRRVSSINTLNWVIHDKKKFAELVDEFRHFNSGLKSILPVADQNNLDRTLVFGQPSGIEELRQLVIELQEARKKNQTKNEDNLYIDAALFKSRMVTASVSSGSGESSSISSKLEIPSSSIDPTNLDSERWLAQYDNKGNKKCILVESRSFRTENSRQLQIFQNRVYRLVELLQSPPDDSIYRILRSIGLIASKDQVKYRLLFALPPHLEAASNPGFFTLNSLLRDEKTNATPIAFSLGDRFQLAGLLAKSILYIHAANWLHHDLNSRNVLCMSPTSDIDITCPYLSGFGFARFDDTKEISEITAASSSTLYMHPDYASRQDPSLKYRRSYELYSLGVMLVEIAFWKRIDTFLKPGMNARSFSEYLETTIVGLLNFHMGSSYQAATLCCLKPELLGVGNDEGRRLSEAFSRKVVRELELCRA
jgi:Prion-inhibition and propagation/Protein tyrosine and serine/threonine kinase